MIVIALAAVAILLIRRKRVTEFVTLVAIAGLTLLTSIQPISDLLLAPLEGVAADIRTTEDPELIVVLGGGAISPRFAPAEGIDESESSPTAGAAAPSKFRVLSGDSIARTSEGAALHLETGLPVAVTGGSPLDEDAESEAIAAKRYLLRLGVPTDAVLVEERSRNTWENARLVAELVESRSIYLVTSAFHMKRSIECFVANGFDVTPRETYPRVSDGGYSLWDFMPSSSSFNDSILALHEYIGRLFYRLRYGSGGYRYLSNRA